MNHNECLTLRKNYFSTNHSSINTIEENTVNDSKCSPNNQFKQEKWTNRHYKNYRYELEAVLTRTIAALEDDFCTAKSKEKGSQKEKLDMFFF